MRYATMTESSNVASRIPDERNMRLSLATLLLLPIAAAAQVERDPADVIAVVLGQEITVADVSESPIVEWLPASSRCTMGPRCDHTYILMFSHTHKLRSALTDRLRRRPVSAVGQQPRADDQFLVRWRRHRIVAAFRAGKVAAFSADLADLQVAADPSHDSAHEIHRCAPSKT